MAKYKTIIWHPRGKKRGIVEELDGDKLEELARETVLLIKSFQRGRPYPVEIFNMEGYEPVLINTMKVQGDRFDMQDNFERARAAQVPVRRTTLRNLNLPIVFTADDTLDKKLTKTDFKRGRKLRLKMNPGAKPRLIQEGRRENFRELIDTEDFEPGRADQ